MKNPSASICAVNARFVFLTGGGGMKRCLRYDVENDLWLHMQPMHQARRMHSSCQLAEFIYVFCGIDGCNSGALNSVEKLAIDVESSNQA